MSLWHKCRKAALFLYRAAEKAHPLNIDQINGTLIESGKMKSDIQER
jgi:hypothetical protein